MVRKAKKFLQVTNTLAYSTIVKNIANVYSIELSASFGLRPGANVIKLYTPLSYKFL
jgi:hypothetical protein